jgi:dCTP deaminase
MIYLMILSANEILKRMGNERPDHKLVIHPYHDASQQPASYDLRSADDAVLEREICTLLASVEWVELPADLAATMRCRSSFGRRGVLLGGGFIDPGFRGHLTMSLTNMGKEDIMIKKNDRVVQMVIHEVAGGERLYNGRYQNSTGIMQAGEL